MPSVQTGWPRQIAESVRFDDRTGRVVLCRPRPGVTGRSLTLSHADCCPSSFTTVGDTEFASAPVVAELDVADLEVSLGFYVGVIGFTVVFERQRERFAFLAFERAELMLQEAAGPGRRFRTAPLEHPFGRGMNLQIAVQSVDNIYGAVLDAGMQPVVPIEERWYDVDVVAPTGKWNASGPMKAGNRQFVVADPDGYLLRLFTSLGTSPV